MPYIAIGASKAIHIVRVCIIYIYKGDMSETFL